MAITEWYVDPSKQTRTAVTIANSTTTATVTQVGHGYANSDVVKIHGATESAYNGNFTISNVTANTYDYTMASDPGGSATGSPLASKLNLSGDDGTSDATAYADLQYLFEVETANTTDGDRIWLKRGTEEVFANDFYWAINDWGTNPGFTTAKSIEGYEMQGATRVRAIARINANETVSTNSTGLFGHYSFSHLHIYDYNSDKVGNSRSSFYNCWLQGLRGVAIAAIYDRCLISDMGKYGANSYGIFSNSSFRFVNCHIVAGPNYFNSHYLHYNHRDHVVNTTYHVPEGVTTGYSHSLTIIGAYDNAQLTGCSFLCEGTESGSLDAVRASNNGYMNRMTDNLIEGFGGGMYVGGTGEPKHVVGYNGYFNNTTDKPDDATALVSLDYRDKDESYAASPFAKQGAIVLDDFYDDNAAFWASRDAYFANTKVGMQEQRGFAADYKGAIPPEPASASPKHPLARF